MTALLLTSLLFLFALLSSRCAHAQSLSASCAVANNDLNAANTQVAMSARDMHDRYNDTCWDAGTCSTSSEQGKHAISHDFNVLRGTDHYQEMGARCADRGHVLCTVTTVVERDLFLTAEVDKPVCFPRSCDADDDAQLRLLDPSPANCDRGGDDENSDAYDDGDNCGLLDTALTYVLPLLRRGRQRAARSRRQEQEAACNILHSTVVCPAEQSGGVVDAAVCAADGDDVEDDRDYVHARRKLHAAMVSKCVAFLFGQSGLDGACHISADVSVAVVQDYTEFQSSIKFVTFLDRCLGAGGNVCRMDVAMRSRLSGGFLDLATTVELTAYPFCLADACDVGTTETDEAVAAAALHSRYPCEGTTCEYDVQDLMCVKLD